VDGGPVVADNGGEDIASIPDAGECLPGNDRLGLGGDGT